MGAVSTSYQLSTYPAASIVLREGESFNVEPGGMLAYQNMTVETSRSMKNLWRVFKNYVLGGESLFVNTFTANKGGGWVALEEDQPGQNVRVVLQPGGKGIVIANGAYLASTPNVNLTTKIAGIRGYMQGKGFATTTASLKEGEKEGSVYFHTTSGIVRKIHREANDLPVVVDNNQLLAHTEGMTLSLQRMGGFKTLFFSGEGLTTEFKGEGDIYVGSGREGESSNSLHIFMKNIGQNCGEWLGKGTIALSVAGLAYYGLPQHVREEIPTLIETLIRNQLKLSRS